MYDAGAFQIVLYNSVTEAFAGIHAVNWGQVSTPQSLAASLVSSFTSCSSGSPVSASQNGAVVTLTSCATGTTSVELVASNPPRPAWCPAWSAPAAAIPGNAGGKCRSIRAVQRERQPDRRGFVRWEGQPRPQPGIFTGRERSGRPRKASTIIRSILPECKCMPSAWTVRTNR